MCGGVNPDVYRLRIGEEACWLCLTLQYTLCENHMQGHFDGKEAIGEESRQEIGRE